MKKYLLIVALILLICPIIFNSSNYFAHAETEKITQEEVENFDDEVNKQLEGLDLSEFDKILNDFNGSQRGVFGGDNFLEKIIALINGDFDEATNVWQAIANVFFESILSFLPILSIVIAVSLLGSMIQGLKSSSNGKSISNLIHFITYGVVVVIILSQVIRLVANTTSTISSLKRQMDAIFPILLTLLTATGGSVSSSIYQPAMALLSGVILNFFTYILLPIFIFSVVFAVVSNLSGNVKLEKFSSFLNSTFKWLIGLVFTIFTAFLSIQGITAISIDGISIRTAKFAIRSYVPILGSYLSDGMGVILASSNLIKNAVGGAGLLLLLATILSPLIELVVFMLILKLTAGIIEPLGNKQIATFISSLSKSMILLIVLIIGISFVYFIILGLIMCSANLI